MSDKVSPLRGHIHAQRRLANKQKIDAVSSEIERISAQLDELLKHRDTLERQYYSPSELAQINLLRRANKQTW